MARVDHHRELRDGLPEAIYGESKTPEQVLAIAKTLWSAHDFPDGWIRRERVRADEHSDAAAGPVPSWRSRAILESKGLFLWRSSRITTSRGERQGEVAWAAERRKQVLSISSSPARVPPQPAEPASVPRGRLMPRRAWAFPAPIRPSTRTSQKPCSLRLRDEIANHRTTRRRARPLIIKCVGNSQLPRPIALAGRGEKQLLRTQT